MIAALPCSLRAAVSPYVGIVRSVEESLRSAADPRFFQATCSVANAPGVLGASLDHLSGLGGAGATRSEAAAAAVGEALERYSATLVPRERLLVATADELGEAAVPPERFALFSQRQLERPGFPFRRFTSSTRVAWVEGHRLVGGEPAFLPAELVYLGPARLPGAGPIGLATSSGLAAAENEEKALVHALLELLERDAFMVTWANRLSLPLLEPSNNDTAGGPDLFERAGLRFAAVDLSCFHALPTVLGVVRAPAEVPGALGVGAAASVTVERAWWRALAEAFASRAAGAKLALLEPGRRFGRRGGGVTSFDDHIRYYADHARSVVTRFLDSSTERVAFAEVPTLEGGHPSGQLEALCRRVEAAGATAFAVNVTSPDVASLGVSVVRVIAPELCPLDTLHSARCLGGRRLYEAAAALGLRPGVLDEREINPHPHPFP